MNLAQRVWEALRPRGGLEWDHGCPSGPPLRTEVRCDALECDSVRLTDLLEGASGVVSCLDGPGGRPARTLAALGVLPGEEVTLEQRSPAYVVKVGHARFALDEVLAGHVRVRPG